MLGAVGFPLTRKIILNDPAQIKKPLCKTCGHEHLKISPCVRHSLTYIKNQDEKLKDKMKSKQRSDEKMKKRMEFLRQLGFEVRGQSDGMFYCNHPAINDYRCRGLDFSLTQMNSKSIITQLIKSLQATAYEAGKEDATSQLQNELKRLLNLK